jgi:hypothetical protein
MAQAGKRGEFAILGWWWREAKGLRVVNEKAGRATGLGIKKNSCLGQPACECLRGRASALTYTVNGISVCR